MKTYDNRGRFKVIDGSSSTTGFTNYRNFIVDGSGNWHEVTIGTWGGGEASWEIDSTGYAAVPAYGNQVDTVLGTDGLFYEVSCDDWGGGTYGIQIGSAVPESNVFASTLNVTDSEYYDVRYDVTTSQPYAYQLS